MQKRTLAPLWERSGKAALKRTRHTPSVLPKLWPRLTTEPTYKISIAEKARAAMEQGFRDTGINTEYTAPHLKTEI
jgi:hypothetical protein